MVGQTISHYEVTEELGRGGMGAVYKARDTLLDRVVALKLLRSDVANPTRERRFIQEAKTASSLNHPNIVTIYEIFHVGEAPCIAMEYVAGETLEQHLEKGRLEFRQGLEWSISMADALAQAHAAGIVHRDVKPSNIIITSTGLLKILDFGLAKLTQVPDDSQAGERLTQDGRIVGTPPYLSPEQAKCEKVDARSDIFSLGAMMYEMFTGKRPFERENNVEMLSAVVKDEPKKLRSFVPELPSQLEKIVSQCLEKKVDRRYQRMDEVKEALDDVRQTETLEQLLATRSPRPVWHSWKFWMAAGVLAVIVTAGLVWWTFMRRQAPLHAPVLTRVTSDEGLTTDAAVSPDGKFLAYASDRGGEALDIWIQPAGGVEAVRLVKHPADDHEPAFSPDGSTIAFRSARDGGGIYVTSILGEAERLIVARGRRPRFSPDGKWIAYWVGVSTGDPTAPGSNKIFVVPSNGGTPKQLVPKFESALYPVWSPDGKHVLFLGAGSSDSSKPAGTLAGTNRPVNRMDWWITGLNDEPPVKTGVVEELTKQGLSVWASSGAGIAPDVWVPDGNQVVFSASFANPNTFRDSVNVWSVPLTTRRWRAAGPATQLTSGTAFESHPAVTPSGDILFSSAEVRTGIWMLPVNANNGEARGELRHLTRGTAFHGQPAVSLDGTRLVYFATKSGNMDIWVLDVESGKESPLTSTPVGESAPLISADGSTVYYSIYGKREAYSMSPQGGESKKICDDCGTWDVSHDGTRILYWYSTAKPVVSIGMVSILEGRKVELISHPQYSLYQPHFSPDDRWIAFLAKTGQDRSRIYVTRYRGPLAHGIGEWVPITDGENLDDKPRWSPDGSLMYFTSERDGFRCIWAQRLHPATKTPAGPPFNVHHFHISRRSLMNVGLGPLEISVARNALVFNLGEITGNVWRASRE
jgi:Tol biopolymer transport system component/predicted Ser/Thr protein kinase